METDDIESTETAQQQSEETLDYESALAKLNEEFDREQPVQTTQKQEHPSDIAALKAEIEALKSHVQGDQTEKAISAAVAAVKGDAELTIPDKYLRKLVVGEVSDNPQLLQAYMQREQNPAKWKKALELVGREIQKDFGKRETTETSDIEAVEASVRSQHIASSDRKTISARNVGSMSPTEYAQWKREQLA